MLGGGGGRGAKFVHRGYFIHVSLCNIQQLLTAIMWQPGDCTAYSIKGIGSVYKRHPVTKFEHGNYGASKRKFNHMTVY